MLTSVARIVALNSPLLTNVVARLEPFHSTVELLIKFAPETVKVKDPLPTTAELGFKLVMRGSTPTAAPAFKMPVPHIEGPQ